LSEEPNVNTQALQQIGLLNMRLSDFMGTLNGVIALLLQDNQKLRAEIEELKKKK